jgi:hypothetical protein
MSNINSAVRCSHVNLEAFRLFPKRLSSSAAGKGGCNSRSTCDFSVNMFRASDSGVGSYTLEMASSGELVMYESG